jgi:cellulose synthase/poly-beta-1,6-N-acetylglucosamine synthase-like glycosyltransferase
VIPASDEAERIEATLTALREQRALDGSPLTPETFDVIVYANNCRDDTAEIVRAFARRHAEPAIHVAEGALPPDVAHIGTARRRVTEAAAARFRAAGRDGVLAGTDADTIPEPTWLAATLDEMRTTDVVLGRILVVPSEWQALPAHTRRRLADEDAYSFVVAELESRVAADRYGAWPRHWQRFGASFAVSVCAHDRAGGIPPVRALEDVAFYNELIACGARVRHSLRVRVWTSARVQSRARGGFADHVAIFTADGASGAPLLVEHPEITLERICSGVARPTAERERVPVAEAIVALRQAMALGVTAARATRNNVASIAG